MSAPVATQGSAGSPAEGASLDATARWPRVRLTDIATIDAPIVDPTALEFRHLPHVSGENIEGATGRLLPLQSAAEDGVMSGKYLFEPGVLLYSKLRPYLRKAAVADFRGLCSADMYPIRFDPGRVVTAYAKFVLLADEFTRYALDQSERARMPKLNRDQLFRYELPLPPLEEQARIAMKLTAKLASAERAATAARARLAAAAALAAACVREVFQGPEASQWARVPLGELCMGGGQYGTSAKSHGQQRGLPVLGMPHIHEGRIRWERVFYVDLPSDETNKYRLSKGDLLFNRTNSAELVGKSAVFDGAREAVFASYLIRFRLLSDKADSRFVSLFINSRPGRAFIERHMGRAVGQVNISASTMATMPIPCPPVDRQTQLVEGRYLPRLAEAERVVSAVRVELAAVDALPAALLREAFARGSPR